MRLARTAAAILCCTTVLFGTTVAASAQEGARIVAVNYPLQYMAQRLAGDAAEVSFPVPEGVDPSFWRPAISDISAIQSADLILLNGAGFATWVDRVSLPRSRLEVTTQAVEDRFIVTESITHSHGDGGEHAHEGLAAYTWLDPTLARAQAEAVAQALTRRGLAAEADVARNLATLSAELEALDAHAAEALASAADTPIIATHPRYQYLAARYGLPISALEWEAGAAPSEAQLAELDALVAETGARILLWEAAPPAAGIEAAAARGLASVIFEPMAHAPEQGDFLQAYRTAVDLLATAAGRTSGN